MPESSQGQEISIDGNTATIVTKNGERIVIDGNTLSRDGKNLFHSFKEFGLTNQQIATFLTNPNIQNILTRVTGGNPSYINGLIEVVGGNSNLFLMNPAGVVFSQGASLNVPADFTATTATGIGFSNGILNAIGNNDYQNLTGNPTNFIFNTQQSGSIINAGDLKVAQGNNINLFAANIINTGTIETPQGKINIQAVKGTSRIKITPEGSLLSLELDIPKDEQGNLLGFTPQDLPSLLTGANNGGVTTGNVMVENNQVQVAKSNIPSETGIVIASGKISTSSANKGGEVTVLGDKVGVIDGEISANGDLGGGKVLLGGERQGKGTIPNAQITVIDKNSTVNADANLRGNGGEVIAFASDYLGVDGQLTAKGGLISGDGGFIETSGLKSFSINTVPDVGATNGTGGEWLIDPYNIAIISEDLFEGITSENPFIAFNNNALLWVGFIQQALINGDVTVSTGISSDTRLPQEGNITWNSDAILDYDNIGQGKTLTLDAANNIIYLGIIDDFIPSTIDSLNIVFNADSDNNQFGAIALFNGSLINTNTGNININANAATTTDINGGFEIIGNGRIITSGITTFNTGQTNIVVPETSPSDFNTVVINSADNVNLYDINTLNLGNSNVNGDLRVTTNGNLTNSGNIIVANNTDINTNGNDILLDVTGNNFQTVNIVNANNVILADINDLTFGNVDSESNPLNISISGDLDLRVTGITNILSNIQANSILTNNLGTTVVNANTITTTGNQTYNNQLNIERNSIFSSATGQLNFNGAVNVSQSLTLESLSGINFPQNALVSANGSNLILRTLNDDRFISINNGNSTLFNISNLNQINGFENIIIGESSSIGSINIDGVLNINDPLSLQASNINVNSSIFGDDNASITIIGAKTTTTLNADIITQGNDITIDDNVILGADVTLAIDNGNNIIGNIDILGTINGNQSLTLNGGDSSIFILGVIGNSQALNNLTVTANTTNLNGGLVLTTGNQTFNGDLLLTNNSTLEPQGFFVSDNIITNGNNVTIIADNINTGNINTSNIEGNGGNIILTSTQDGILTQNLNSSGNNGGAIALNSGTTIETQGISSIGNTQNGGNVTINSLNDIQLTNINTRSNNLTGGNVNILTSGRLRITETIGNTNFSIDSSGNNGGGSINISFFPEGLEKNQEDPRLPFIVGDPSNNGTLGLITTGDFTVEPGEYFDTFQLGNIGVVLLDPQPETPQPETPQPETPQPETPQPETPQPETPQPETPQPETPQPETPQPETPQPETPQPETPQPETPQPETPQPETPQPETPQPETPQPETPVNSRTEKLNLLQKEGDPNNAIPSRFEVKTLGANLYPSVIPIATIAQAQEILTLIEQETPEKPALIYVTFTPKGYEPPNLEKEFARREVLNTQEYSQVDITLSDIQPTIPLKPSEEDQLDLLIITRKGAPIRLTVPVTREQVVQSATNLWSSASDNFALNDNYKPYATELYSWLITPLEDKLKKEEISNLLFILPTEIRFLPVAALYDGNNQQFLVEKYSSGLAPSLNLNDNSYRPIKDLNLLAMGAAQFADDQVTPLPAVGLELPTIQKVWNGKATEDYQRYLNNNFTFDEIKQNLGAKSFGIVHFGTHGEFNPTETTDSFIQLYNSRLKLGELRNLGLNQPLVELMVLSACDTAFGNEIAELGFAGLAVQAGVKTSLGSVWQVSDTGTLALMTDFYGQLKTQSTKAESLRQAQLNMLQGKIYKTEDGNEIITPELEVSLDGLPENSRQKEDFSHPFYWAPFTMIGNPW
ncbi:flagelliform silk protein [Geminocystis sp. NIES-3708]|uniref:CHAT domain-containing protein n=1 Tax=Geminocystis sp. NIES-3708 TaxID=1615909 RepID=UPI0005FC520D|nr:CHAT domain-containing protein [Geminocystis sp. NIES-3708]BAQ62602.1 flagelliform silk protein [Geminocystis sp. NIES-3708]